MGWGPGCLPETLITSRLMVLLCGPAGCLIGSAVVPIASCLSWSKANWWGAVAGAFIGQASGITMWLVRPAPPSLAL